MSVRGGLRYVLALAALLSALCSVAANADERVLAYHSDIRIDPDGAMTVTETIRVRAEGISIRRGIYRTFPTTYRDRLRNFYRVGYRVVGLTRDGRPEPWNAYREANGVRVDFGGDALLPVPADYEYALTYRTNRQLGFFADHDELYWNVTGNGWDFPIDSVSATVTLPVSVPAAQLTMEGYTGPFGAAGQDYTAAVADGQGTIQTTVPLRPREGLTLVLSWPKGVIREPGAAERAQETLEDNRSVLIAALAFLGAAVWLGYAWTRTGRDPAPGVIFPHYSPPEGFSPGLARYVVDMGYDARAFTAALLNLAVQGHVHITQLGKKYTLQRRESLQQLADDEKVLLEHLFAAGPTLELVNRNHAIVGGAQGYHARALTLAGRGTYFHTNSRYLVPSILGSILLAVLMFASGEPAPLAFGIFFGVLVMHVVFAWMLQAPTPEGRAIMDKLEGFRLYLDVAEKDEMNLRNPPELTPQLFERFLPFAIALGVEHAWGERFERALALLPETTRAAYHPLWYTGAFNPAHTGDFTRNLGSSFSSAISSAATAPGTSSGAGGGGFSGGGGGGGGGGGR